MNDGHFYEDACRIVGIRGSTFEKVCEKDPDLFIKLREAVVDHWRQYAEYEAARNAALLQWLGLQT